MTRLNATNITTSPPLHKPIQHAFAKQVKVFGTEHFPTSIKQNLCFSPNEELVIY